MQLNEERKNLLEEQINNLILNEFKWCKDQILESKAVLGGDVEDSSIWLSYRNAMDRVLILKMYLLLGEYPDDNEDPDNIITHARYLFLNTGIETWTITCGIAIGRLNDKLNDFSTYGDREKAMMTFKTTRQLYSHALVM